MAHQPAHAKDAFTGDALERVATTIAEVEKLTSAEIRISILDERDTSDSELKVEELAKKEFFRLKMDETKNHSGILLFILYAERKFYVYGDTGINSRLQQNTWNHIAATLTSQFSHGHFEEGLHLAVREIAKHLETAIPYEADDTDELSNTVNIG